MNDSATPTNTAELTAEIVSAYVSNNRIAPSELGSLIRAVANQLTAVGAEPEQLAEEAPQPAVPVRRSVQPNQLICLLCGKPQKMLKRHLAHGLTTAQCSERFGLKHDYLMAAPNYVQQRRELALRIGLGGLKQAMPRRRSTAGRKAKKPGS